jgi:hypothetical protein
MNGKNKESYWTDAKFVNILSTADKLLGMCGRMLYTSKSMKQPTTIFNANIFNAKAKKIWFGDIEIERDKEALLKLSRKLGPLYILWEMDGRFLDFIPSIGYIKSRAAVTVEDGVISYSKEFAEYVEVLRERLNKNTKNSTRRIR